MATPKRDTKGAITLNGMGESVHDKNRRGRRNMSRYGERKTQMTKRGYMEDMRKDGSVYSGEVLHLVGYRRESWLIHSSERN